jgi:Circularly permuted ATP-grasp type 2
MLISPVNSYILHTGSISQSNARKNKSARSDGNLPSQGIEKGLKQRVYALNLFIDDIYHQQKIVRDKVVPEYLIRSAGSFGEACVGLDPPQGIWCHITAPTWSATGMVNFMFWKIISVVRRRFRTSWKIAGS